MKNKSNEFDFFNEQLGIEKLYQEYRKSVNKPLQPNRFKLAFLAWMETQLDTGDEDQEYDIKDVEKQFSGQSFHDMVANDLTGVKAPSQEKDEILFKMISQLSAKLDSSKQNLYFLEVLRNRWFIAQKHEPYF